MRRSRNLATCAALLGAVFAACLAGDSTEWFGGNITGPCDEHGFCTPADLIVNDCVGRARHCTTVRLQAGGADQQPIDVRAAFQACLGETTIAMPGNQNAVCQNACAGDEAGELCDKEIEVLTGFAQAPRCAWYLEDCMDSCTAEGETARDGEWIGTGLSAQPEAMCLSEGSTRASCAVYAQSRQRCGGANDRPTLDHGSCMDQCDATYGIWHPDSGRTGDLAAPLCTGEDELQPVGVPANATPLEIEQARIRQMHQGLPIPGANASPEEKARYQAAVGAESTVCGYCRSACRTARLADLQLAPVALPAQSHTVSRATPLHTTFDVQDGTARLKVRADAQGGVVKLEIRAPGERAAFATCTSTRECVIRPLWEQVRGERVRRSQNVTTGTWTIDVSTLSETPVDFNLVVSTASATTTTAGR